MFYLACNYAIYCEGLKYIQNIIKKYIYGEGFIYDRCIEDKKNLKGKVLEEPTMEPESDPLLVLRIFNGEAGERSKKKEVNILDLFGPESPKASPDSNDEDAKQPAEMRQHDCKFCDRKFPSSQA